MTMQLSKHTLACAVANALFIAVCLTAPMLTSAEPLEPAPAVELDGHGLAMQLSSMEPVESSEIHGTLCIKLKRKHSEAPFVCKVIRRDTTWDSVFQAQATEKIAAETLVIIHTPGAPNRYLYAKAQSPTNTLVEPQPISAEKAAVTAFAGSDYSLADLGLDFLQWTSQERLRGRTRLNRACYVLESRNDHAPEVVRVRSFIDREYAGTLGSQGFPAILVVEAYNSKNEMIKEFSLHGSSFKKVDGRYRLEQMEITNLKTGSQTTMKFD